jgi:hypothetical protein
MEKKRRKKRRNKQARLFSDEIEHIKYVDIRIIRGSEKNE